MVFQSYLIVFIVLSLVEITLQSEYLVSQEFTSKTFSDSNTWSINRVTQCASTGYTDFSSAYLMGVLGNSEYQKKTFSSLPPHWSLSIRFDLLLLESLDQYENDHVEIFLDGVQCGSYEKVTAHEGLFFCSNGDFEDSLILYNKNISHTANTLEVKIFAKSNEPIANEGFGIRNFFLYLDTCDPSCLTCNGPSSNQCLTCPINSTKTLNSCACNAGYFLHQNSCVATCPTGYVKNPNGNNCVLNNCTGCSSCDATNNVCSTCSTGYLYKGSCVSSCPYTAPLTAGVCKDYDSTLINGKYLLNGLNSNYFGESEIKGMGFVATGFQGFKDVSSTSALTTHCSTTHLFGGFYLSGKGSSIARSWTGLSPHWSVKLGFSFWKIDSWDSEYFQLNVDNAQYHYEYYNYGDGGSSKCGLSYNDYANVYSTNFTHTSSSLSINIFTNLDETPMNESYGIRDVYLLMDFCTDYCTSCNASGCSTCQSTYLMYYKKCYATCPIGSYQNSSTTCADCNPSCKTCNSPGNICTSCYTPNFLNPGTGLTCLPTCPTSYWQNTSDRTCQQCHSSCYTCSSPGDQNSCLSCSGTLYLNNNQCISTCPSNTYYNTVTNNNKCSACNSSCKTCDGPNSTNCLSCTSPSYYQQTLKTCVSSCDSNQYGDNTQVKCILCESTCKTCSGPNNNNCLSCNNPLFFDATITSCTTTCPSNTYKNTSTNVCTGCHGICKTCSGNQSNNCLTCALPKYFQSTTNSCDSSCPSNQYKNDSVPACSNCDSTCATCSGGLATNCLTCTGSYYLDKTTNKCITICPTGTFKDGSNNECTPCHNSCYTCNGKNSNQCLSCSSPLFFQSTPKTCVNSCDSNQYSVTTPARLCQNCNISCATCSGPSATECLSCSGNYLNTSSHTCGSTCPAGTYQNTPDNLCSPCHGDCKTCSGPGNNQCLSCTLPNYFQQSSFTCVTSCNINQFKNDATPACNSCHATCASCTGSANNNCLSCNGTLFLDNTLKTCGSTCPTNQYPNQLNNLCTSCHSNCATCNGGTSNNCLTCSLPLYFQSSTSSCETNCLSNQYKSSTPTPQCLPCHSTCATCSGPADTQCLSCSGTDLFLQDPASGSSSCKQQCPDGTYKNTSNKQCSKCDSTCKTCNDTGNAKCLTCSLPRYFHSTTNECVLQCDTNQYQENTTATCVNCHLSCETCSASSDTSCLSCSGSLYLNSVTHQCLNSCPNNYFKNTLNNKCTQCESSCYLCDGGTKNNCLACQSPLYFQSDTKSCGSSCYINQYKDNISQACSSCDLSCASCSGKDQNNCLSCSGSTYLNSVTKTCDSTCPDGTFQNTTNNQCSPCESSCKTCNNSSNTSCLSCSSPKLLQKSSHQCVASCNSNQYSDNSILQCMDCNPSCTSCSGPSSNECTKCSGLTFLDPLTKSCVSVCPVGYYKNTVDNNCTKCESSCHSCDGGSSSDCLDCSLPLYYQTSSKQCVSSCNTNQYKDSVTVQCKQCHSECFSCSNGSNDQCTSCDGLRYLDKMTNQCVTTCPDGKYKNNTNHVCSDCDSTCKTCSGNLQTNCISCSLPRYYQFSSSSCDLACQVDQYKDNLTATCKQCDTSCASCSGPNKNECLTCSGTLFLDSTTNQCISICPDSYYANTNDNTCQKCDHSCKTCNNKFDTSCLTCDLPLYYHATSSKCISDCDPNQFKDSTQVKCVNCHAACKSCSGPSETECLSCPSTTYLNEAQHNCINSCPDGQFENKSNNTCTKCNSKCLTCSEGSDKDCLTCSLPLYLQQLANSCDSQCKQNQYPDDKDAQCKECHSTCSSCTGPSDTQCKTCSGTKYLYNNKCIDTCPDGMYQEKSDNTCQKCNSSCQNCDGGSSNNCLSCNPGQYLHQNGCLTNCPDKFYKNNSIQACSACSNQCENCIDSTSTACLSCPQGYLLQESSCVISCNSSYFQEKSSPKCTKCDTSCQTCSDSTNNSCTSCQNTKYLQNGQCSSSCMDGSYADNIDNTCKNCHTTCSTCSGSSASQCNKCDSTRFLYNNTCVKQCPDGFYNNAQNQNCSKCDTNCSTCTSGSDKSCQSCQGTLFLYQNQCVLTCPDGFFQDKSTNKCSQCNNVCQTCTSFTNNSCISCKNGTFFQSNTCVNECSKGTFGEKSTNQCEKCDSTCDTCNGPSAQLCLTCTGTKFEYQNKCVDICPTSYFKNGYNNTCQKCHESCESCTGDSKSQCSSCSSTTFLYENQCMSVCPIGLYKSLKTNTCELCDTKCQSCSGPTEKDCLSCKKGTILQESLCLKECSDGYYQNNEKQQCSQCHASCLKCTGPNNNQCQICPNSLMKHEDQCISSCPSKTYLLETPIKQCMDCDSTCVSNCSGPGKEDCETIKPQNQLIVIILCLKTAFWVISVFVGYLKDQKFDQNDKNKVVPSRINFDDIEVDSPVGKTRIVKQDVSQVDSTMFGSPIPVMKKQSSFSSPEKKPITLQQLDGNQPQSSYFPSTFQDLNNEYNMTFQNMEGESPKSKRRSRRTEFILRARGNKHLFSQIQSNSNSNSPTQNSPSQSGQNTSRGGSSSQVFDKLVPQPPTLASYQSSIFANENSTKNKLPYDQKLKFSIFGNEWFSLFSFHDSQISRVSRSTLIYLKYQMFFFICNQFSMSPLYYVLACLSCGLALKFIIGNFLALVTKYSRFGSKLAMVIFLSSIICDFYFWFIPTLITLKYAKDLQWSILYGITFSIDFLVLQQVFGLISYLCTVKYINEEKKEKSINKYFKNSYLMNKLKN